MYCPSCGLNNKDGATNCSRCGSPLPLTPPKKQSKFVRLLKAVLMCVLAILVFNGCQVLVVTVYSAMCTANMMLNGEIPMSTNPDDIPMDQMYETIMQKISENTTGILLVANLLTILFICLGYTIKRKSPARELDVNGVGFMRYIGIAVFGMALQVFVLVTLGFIPFPEAVYAEHDAAFQDLGNTGNLALELFSVGIVTGIAEEIVYRGMVLKYLKRVIHPVAAIIISAVVFGLAHSSLLSMVYATVVGLVLGALYVKFDSIVPAIVCHVFFNMTSSLLSLMSDESGLLVLGMYVASIVIVFRLGKGFFIKYPTVSDLLFDSRGRIKPKSEEEAAVIAQMNSLKANGVITEADLNRLDREWESAKKNTRKASKIKTPTITPDINNDDKNEGDSNEAL
ncbi:MAG: CPBP family intramembrane metalloprotease [Ruminococcaceae bacterium]|nr:CPBP family intramembrane metalloprotease [Oscillospiraceae bacterium]